MVILAAIDGEQEEDHVVEIGYDLATAYDDELVVLHIMEQEIFEKIRGSDRSAESIVTGGITYTASERSSPKYDLEKAMADAKGVAQECVTNTLGNGIRNVASKGRVGDPATEIVEEASRIDARYLVVGGRKRSPTGKAIFGSVAQSVILNAERPVMTVIQGD